MIPGGNQVIAKDIIRTTGLRVIKLNFQITSNLSYGTLYIRIGLKTRISKIHKIKYLDIEFK